MGVEVEVEVDIDMERKGCLSYWQAVGELTGKGVGRGAWNPDAPADLVE